MRKRRERKRVRVPGRLYVDQRLKISKRASHDSCSNDDPHTCHVVKSTQIEQICVCVCLFICFLLAIA